jgi:hypothetical protein
LKGHNFCSFARLVRHRLRKALFKQKSDARIPAPAGAIQCGISTPKLEIEIVAKLQGAPYDATCAQKDVHA